MLLVLFIYCSANCINETIWTLTNINRGQCLTAALLHIKELKEVHKLRKSLPQIVKSDIVMRVLLLILILGYSQLSVSSERPLFGYLIPLKPTPQHCELANQISALNEEERGSYDAHLNNAGGCAYYSGNIEKAIEFWSEAYTKGIDRSLQPLARVLALSDIPKDRLLGASLLRAYIELNPNDAYLLPLFLGLQKIAYSELVNKNLVFEYLNLAFELELEQKSFVTVQVLHYLRHIEYFSDDDFQQKASLLKLYKRMEEQSISYCYISDSLTFDIFKLPSDDKTNQYYKKKCVDEMS